MEESEVSSSKLYFDNERSPGERKQMEINCHDFHCKIMGDKLLLNFGAKFQR